MPIYIAGPMTGIEHYNFPMFYAAEQALVAFGFLHEEIGNPAYHDAEVASITHMTPSEQGDWLLQNPEAFSLADAQTWDLYYIHNTADAICLLPGWEKSTGARAEAHLALWLGHQFYLYVPFSQGIRALTRDEAKSLLLDMSAPEAAAYKDSTDHHEPKGEVRTTSRTGGQKGTKAARFDLIPPGPLRALAEHYGRGALKYADHQWRQGYEYGKSFSAAQRHSWDWLDGKTYDVCENHPEECSHVDADGNTFVGMSTPNGSTCFNHTGSHHMICMAWHAFLLFEFETTHPDHDDRYKTREQA